MKLEIVLPQDRVDQVKNPLLISICASKQVSHFLLQDHWGSPMMKQSIGKQAVREDGRILNASEEECDFYLALADTAIRRLKASFGDIAILDLRVIPDLRHDLELSCLDQIKPVIVEPAIKNMELSRWNFSCNSTHESYLLSKLCNPSSGIYGLRLSMAERLFSTKENAEEGGAVLGMKMFEQTLIFLSLSLRGKI